MASWLYEGLLLFGVLFIADYLFDTLSQSRHALVNREIRQAFLFVVLGIYFSWFWSKGQTLPMKTWHIRVVDREGKPLSQARAWCRYVVSWVWLLPPLMLAWLLEFGVALSAFITFDWIVFWAALSMLHPEKQFWHDAWVGTRLVTSLPHSPRAEAAQR